jgi:hypothetical protein
MGATNPSPLILNLRRKGKGGTRKFKFSGAKTRTEDYIVGVVLDGVSPTVQAYLIRKFQNRTYLTYSEMKIMGRFIKFMYRVYNWRHIRNFKVVNAEEYVNMVLGRFK